MKYLFPLLLFLSITQSKAQDVLFGPTIAYQNQSGNFGKIGAFVIFGNKTFLKTDVNLNIANMRGQTVVIPELGLTYYQTPANFYELEITPYTLTPKIGLSLFTFVDIGLGYGFSYNEKNNFKPIKGFTTSINLNIPLNFKFKMF